MLVEREIDNITHNIVARESARRITGGYIGIWTFHRIMCRAITIDPGPVDRVNASVHIEDVIKVDVLLPKVREAIQIPAACRWVVIGCNLDLTTPYRTTADARNAR